MYAIRRIVVGVDFSPAGDRALREAVAVALHVGARLHLVHAIHLPTPLAPLDELRVEEHVWALAGSELARRAEDAATGGLAVSSEVRSGLPADMLCEVARERRADLLVVGSHGRSPLAHLVLGSVAERTLRHAPCPVLVVGGRERRGREARESGHCERPHAREAGTGVGPQ